MKRITGNWFRKYDPKEKVVSIWPSLEEVLERMGLSFSFEDCLLFDSIFEYNGKLPYQRDAKEIFGDIQHSRERFIRGINRFSYDRLATTASLDGMSIDEHLYVSTICLSYIDSNRERKANLQLLPGRHVTGQMLYVGIHSTPKSMKRNDRLVQRVTDASNLIVKISGDPKIEREIRKVYQQSKRSS